MGIQVKTEVPGCVDGHWGGGLDRRASVGRPGLAAAGRGREAAGEGAGRLPASPGRGPTDSSIVSPDPRGDGRRGGLPGGAVPSAPPVLISGGRMSARAAGAVFARDKRPAGYTDAT